MIFCWCFKGFDFFDEIGLYVYTYIVINLYSTLFKFTM